VSTAKAGHVARIVVAAGALVLAGASGSSQPARPAAATPAGFGSAESAGPGALAASVAPPGAGASETMGAGQGSFGANAVRAPFWDVEVALSPVDAQVVEKGGTWQLTSDDNRGAVTVVVMRDPSVRDAWALADTLRTDRKNKGEDVTDVEQEMLVGLPGARWISVASTGVATMVVLAQTKSCVYMLIASSQGTTEEIVAYFKWASALVRTVSGQPADAPACR
jgi:hypothetical protein